VADSYAAHGIHLHVDVGADPGGVYAGSTADPTRYVPAALARGGELIQETTCAQNPECRFPAFPGTVGWMLGFQHYAHEPVGPNGEELTPADVGACLVSGSCRHRFDRNRTGLFHHVLYAHARAKSKSLPCLDAQGVAVDVNPQNSCTVAPNPLFNAADYHVPSSRSGIANLPGSRVLVSLGLWDASTFIGTPFIQASTTMHELGHNFELYHGGATPIWGTGTSATYVEPNCKPNYLSVMSYLF